VSNNGHRMGICRKGNLRILSGSMSLGAASEVDFLGCEGSKDSVVPCVIGDSSLFLPCTSLASFSSWLTLRGCIKGCLKGCEICARTVEEPHDSTQRHHLVVLYGIVELQDHSFSPLRIVHSFLTVMAPPTNSLNSAFRHRLTPLLVRLSVPSSRHLPLLGSDNITSCTGTPTIASHYACFTPTFRAHFIEQQKSG
jgi:hypothetical protein